MNLSRDTFPQYRLTNQFPPTATGSRTVVWVFGVLAFLLVLLIAAVVSVPSSGTTTPSAPYIGPSATCDELQSEFNAAYARSMANVDDTALGIMNATDARMRQTSCYSR